MKSGIPLTDEDRQPWLETLNDLITRWIASGQGGVLACSALKKKYRSLLARNTDNHLLFVYLHGTKELILKRCMERQGHFMPASLIDSQFAALEEPTKDEPCLTVDVSLAPDEVIGTVECYLRDYAL
eukprot:Colp12_sorted_trinity150504_noHs@31353